MEHPLVILFERIKKDDDRVPIISDNDDWDIITPALVEWGQMLEIGRFGDLGEAFKVMRVILEGVYQMGYERGIHESSEAKE